MSEPTPELKVFIATGINAKKAGVPVTIGAKTLTSLIESYGNNRFQILYPNLEQNMGEALLETILQQADLVVAEGTGEDGRRDSLVVKALETIEVPVLVFFEEGKDSIFSEDHTLHPNLSSRSYNPRTYTLDSVVREALRELGHIKNPFNGNM